MSERTPKAERETPKSEAPEAAKAQTPGSEAAKASNASQSEVEAPKAEAPKASKASKDEVEAPRSEAPKDEAPKAEGSGVQARRYLLTGGGTGGHVYPAIAMADALKRREPHAEFLYVGVKGKSEEKIVPARGYPLTFVTSRGWPGARPSLALLLFALSLGWGVLKALGILRKYKPHVIIATGGYVAAPIMLAWVLLKKLGLTQARAFVHEQNLVPGRLNRLVGQMADRVGVSFEESIRYFPNALWVGYPARSEISQQQPEASREALGLPKGAKILLAFGGSQGSRTINRAVVDALPELLKDEQLHVVHGVGRHRGGAYNPKADTEARLAKLSLGAGHKQRYHMHEYLDPIEKYYAAADLVVCRAGAGSLTEVALCRLPALIIPKANLPGDHQVRNARALGSRGAGQVLYEQTKMRDEGLIEVVEGSDLADAALSLLADEEARRAMSEAMGGVADADALSRIVDAVQSIASGHLPEVSEAPPRDDKPELSEYTGGQLVSYISRHGRDALDPDELEYLAYRTDGYLASPAWQTRNIGVKLVGLLKLEDRLELILYILKDPTPAPQWHRALGGDLHQVGFIRRNAVQTLRQLGVWDERVREAFLRALKDRYFEVRSWAAKALAHFADDIGQDEAVLQTLDGLCEDRSFEVVCAALRTLAEIDTRADTYRILLQYFTVNNWRIREAVVFCLMRFVQRGVLSPEQVDQHLEQLLVTSSGFVPHFQLREQIRELSQALEQVRESACSTP